MYQQLLLERTVNGVLASYIYWADGVPPLKVHLPPEEVATLEHLIGDLSTFNDYVAKLKAGEKRGPGRPKKKPEIV